MISMIDESGKPRSDEEIEEVIVELKKELISFKEVTPLFIHIPTILESLNELLMLRRALRAKATP